MICLFASFVVFLAQTCFKLTFAIDERVRLCATLTNDTLMLGKLAQGDMIAMESKYHPACILSFYRKAAAVQTEINVEMNDAVSPHVNAE
jgi:hypothetical protein